MPMMFGSGREMPSLPEDPAIAPVASMPPLTLASPLIETLPPE